jgi:hypothetical protein
MPTSFLGLFLFSTALSLMATFTALRIQAVIQRLRGPSENGPPRLR